MKKKLTQREKDKVINKMTKKQFLFELKRVKHHKVPLKEQIHITCEDQYSANRREWEKLTTHFYADTIDYLQGLLNQVRRLLKRSQRHYYATKSKSFKETFQINCIEHQAERDLLKKIIKALK